ncbi:MAG: glutamate--cysteine ligase, partial [Perlucidibaca sp.]
LRALPSGTLYLPEATSLRMSSLGYQNDAQSGLRVSYNALDEYIRDLDRAIRTPYAPYEAAGVVRDGVYQQINANILQIENEYYGLIRPKQVTRSGERPTQALARRGVEYVELRCVDLDPFEPLGISRASAHFLEVFALHCLLSDSPGFNAADYQRLPLNQQAMVERGRDPELMLQSEMGSRYFRDMAARLFAELLPVADVLDRGHGTAAYSAAIELQIAKLKEPAMTGSAMVLRSLEDYQGSFYRFAQDRADRTREEFLARPLPEARMAELTTLARQ